MCFFNFFLFYTFIVERLPSVYRLKVPWFREDSFITSGYISKASHVTCFIYLPVFTFLVHVVFWLVLINIIIYSIPSVTEISAMLHTSRQDNTSSALLQLHTAPNCQYKVTSHKGLVCPLSIYVPLGPEWVIFNKVWSQCRFQCTSPSLKCSDRYAHNTLPKKNAQLLSSHNAFWLFMLIPSDW